MKDVLKDEPEEFVVPEGIVRCIIDPVTGLLSKDETTGVTVYFKEGTEPRQFATPTSIWELRESPKDLNYD
jgi:membrane carboxypeptidase/penicillin-binding protein